MEGMTIERRLWHREQSERVELAEPELKGRSEPLVILGEAGMGKTFLLKSLARTEGYAFCTARQIINRINPSSLLGDAKVLVIDALDEVSSKADGDAVDAVLQKLGELGYPRFVLSCRVADWRSSTGVAAIREQYDLAPLELHLEPFSEQDAQKFLVSTLGESRASEVVEHFRSRGLEGMTGNPQTLVLVARVAMDGRLPDTKSELLRIATELLRREHNEARPAREPSSSSSLSAAWAAFASLIITGGDSIARSNRIGSGEGELALRDLAELPGASELEAMLGTRLFSARGPEHFSYLHRTVGEYLGARWLSALADTPRKQRRLLSQFHTPGLVPASLRGLHAWLAVDPSMAIQVINADPMGVVEYGDADSLTAPQARALLKALGNLAVENPDFSGWGDYSLRGLDHDELVEEVRSLVVSPDKPLGLRLLVVRGIKGTSLAQKIALDLITILHDKSQVFVVRSASATCLIELPARVDWSQVDAALYALGDTNSVRLALEIVSQVGTNQFDDKLLCDLVIAQVINDPHTFGPLFGFDERMSERRIPDFLDLFAQRVYAHGKPHERRGDNELTDIGFALIARGVETPGLDMARLWRWLMPFDWSSGYTTRGREKLAAILKAHDNLRQSIQKYVMLDLISPDRIFKRGFRLSQVCPVLAVTEEDVLYLLGLLDPNNASDLRWIDLVEMVRHDGEKGKEIRNAAESFAVYDAERRSWLEKISTPVVPDYQLKREADRKRREEERAQSRAQHRQGFLKQIDNMRAGKYGALVNPAKAYLKLFADVGNDLPAHLRISSWLDEEISDAAMTGFEASLWLDPKPTSEEIADGVANGQHWDAALILVVALAERLRLSRGFVDLPDERVTAGLFEVRYRRIHHHAGIDGLEGALEQELQRREIWTQAMRDYHEPQLTVGRSSIDGLYSLMRSDEHAELGTELAAEWILKFRQLPAAVESELTDRLLRSRRLQELMARLDDELGASDIERRLNWQAIGLLVDFERIVEILGDNLDRDLLWSLRDKLGSRSRSGTSGLEVSVEQLSWIIQSFRKLWPVAPFPTGGVSGDTNPWDASEFISGLIARLGANVSEQATRELAAISKQKDGYDYKISVVSAEHKRLRVEASYVAPTLEQFKAIVSDELPASMLDLQGCILEELMVAQGKIASDDAESWRGFFDDKGSPHNEERCRDHLLSILRQGSHQFVYDPETHVGQDKEVDITASAGVMRLPVEVKGQWHVDVLTGADAQLDRLYASDFRAERRGIYLALWFGDKVPKQKQLKAHPTGEAKARSAAELREQIVAGSKAAQEGRIQVVVLEIDHRKVLGGTLKSARNQSAAED